MLPVTLTQVGAGCGRSPECQACWRNAELHMLLSRFCPVVWLPGVWGTVAAPCCKRLQPVILGLTLIRLGQIPRPAGFRDELFFHLISHVITCR